MAIEADFLNNRYMRKFLIIMFLLIVSLGASSQVRFGIKLGENLTDLRFSGDYMEAQINKTGFFVGPTVKARLSKSGLGMDAAILYDWRFAQYGASFSSHGVDSCFSINRGIAYFVLPVSLRYDFKLNENSDIFIKAGPQVALTNASSPRKNEKYNNMVLSANFGFGVFVKNNLEVSLNYNLVLDKTFVGDLIVNNQTHHFKGKYNALQFSTAIYF